MKESDQERRERLRDEVAVLVFVAAVHNEALADESIQQVASAAWEAAGAFVGKDPELYPGAPGAWAGNASQEDA
jgi:hypothetical protein